MEGHLILRLQSIPLNFLLLYINFACLSVCPFVTKKRQLGWTVRAQIFCGTTRDLKEGLLDFQKCVSNKIRFFENFENP